MERRVVGPVAEDLLLHRLLDARRGPKPVGEFRGWCRSQSCRRARRTSVPSLLGLSPRDLDGVPLAMFQCTEFTRPDIERLVRAINAVAARPISETQVSLRFRREWPILHDEVGRIDISQDDSEEKRAPEDEASPPPTKAAPPPAKESTRSARFPLAYTSPEQREFEWIRMNWATDDTATKMIEGSQYFIREATRRAAKHAALRDDYLEAAPGILLRQFIVDCPEAFRHSRFDSDTLQEMARRPG